MAHAIPADPPPGTRHSNLKRSFKLGARSLLTALSKEDVFKAFPTFSNLEKERLHRMFMQVIKSLHGNIEEEFEAVCQETQVGSSLDTIEQLVEEQSLDMLSGEALNVGEIKEQLSKVKEDEIYYLTSLLEKCSPAVLLIPNQQPLSLEFYIVALQAEKQNDLMRARVESLSKGKEDVLATTDAINKLKSWNSNHEKLLNSCCSKFSSG
ncbi:hypothetical protein Taro_024596 [Colocasia esculenta]|uniref:Polyamine-modulated factor 1 n=1 Tax=Colocasia esculenta TaxID=4460 RepID=A0A843V770_COLES|nr:hypothetical protein [Colocasia esculenta]